jgi:hypothetical protein
MKSYPIFFGISGTGWSRTLRTGAAVVAAGSVDASDQGVMGARQDLTLALIDVNGTGSTLGIPCPTLPT